MTVCPSAHTRTVGHASCNHNIFCQARWEPIQQHPKASGSLSAQRFQRQRVTPLTCTTPQLSPSLGPCNHHQSSSHIQCQLQNSLFSNFQILLTPQLRSPLGLVPIVSLLTLAVSRSRQSRVNVSQVRVCLSPVKREIPRSLQWTGRILSTTPHHRALGQGANTPGKAEKWNCSLLR